MCYCLLTAGFVYVNRFRRQRVQFVSSIQDVHQESGYLRPRSARSTASNMYLNIGKRLTCDNPKNTQHGVMMCYGASEWGTSFIILTGRVVVYATSLVLCSGTCRFPTAPVSEKGHEAGTSCGHFGIVLGIDFKES